MTDGNTRTLAILGQPVSHSLSPAMQGAALRALGVNAAYLPLACSGEDLPGLMRGLARSGGGGNITLPHKVAAASILDEPSATVGILGACNTFWGRDGRLCGDNTDVAGILGALDELNAPSSSWHVVGTGGAARAVVEAARLRSASLSASSRTKDRAAAFLQLAADRGVAVARSDEAEVVINATPLGLRPDDPLPLDPSSVPGARFAVDMVYRQGRTAWIRAMRTRGLEAEDGRSMLVSQGAEAFRKWFPELDPPVDVMRAAVADALR